MPGQTTRYRRAVLAVTFSALAALTLTASPLHAATTTTNGTTTTTGPQVMNGFTVGPAVITTPGKPTRHLTVSQNTAFMQSWLPDSIFEHIPNIKRPTNLTISTLHMTTKGPEGLPTPILVFYATDGKTAMVGMPRQDLGYGSVDSEKWIVSPFPGKTIAAFAGKLQAANLNTGTTTTPTTAAPSTTLAPASSSGSSSSTWIWFAIPAVIVVGIGVALALRRRGSAATTS